MQRLVTSRYLDEDGRKGVMKQRAKTERKGREGGEGAPFLVESCYIRPGNYRDYTIIIIDRPLNIRIC